MNVTFEAEISYDGENWTDYDMTASNPTITADLNIGDRVYIRPKHNVTTPFAAPNGLIIGPRFASFHGSWSVHGDIAYMISPTGTQPLQTFTAYNGQIIGQFRHFFDFDGLAKNTTTGVLDVSDLKLGFPVLTEGCYESMFAGGPDLLNYTQYPNIKTTAKHKAKVLAPRCYYGMYSDCDNLVDISSAIYAPDVWAENAYYEMFNGCDSLSAPPNLPENFPMLPGMFRNMFNNSGQNNTVTLKPAQPEAWNDCLQQIYRSSNISVCPDKRVTLDLSHFTSVPPLSSSTNMRITILSKQQDDARLTIKVPANLYEEFTTATTWATFAPRMVAV
ncbi:hypothetical protein [Fibrobacter sp.]|uniref:hypothetical protein n=1 Tax=Fibrobacter sp. TaxID=35828 RepID=UPI0038910E59